MKYRIKRKHNGLYYPQYKYKWWPFWISFKEKFAGFFFPIEKIYLKDAQDFLNKHKKEIYD